MGEKEYYPAVRKWLEKKGYYCGGFITDSKDNPIYYQDKGTARLRVDVAGVKNVGSNVSDEIEVVSVEVKDANNVSVRDIHDASAYAQYAHRCYLATTAPVNDQDRRDAQKLGVGLLQIRNNRITEALRAQFRIPNHSAMIKFLHILDIARCPICLTFFEIYVVKDEKYKSFHRLARPRYFKAAHDQPKVDTLDAEKLKKLKASYKSFRYICRTCMEEFFPHKLVDFHATYDE